MSGGSRDQGGSGSAWWSGTDSMDSAAPRAGGVASLVGQTVDRYVVEEALGQGGFATVYKVRHHVLGTVHALKVLNVNRPQVLQRVVQEGRIQAGLRHPNLVGVTDLIDMGGSLGLLMDYVEGQPLDRWLAHNRPAPAQAQSIFTGIVQGVAAAHRRGVVHRDLKPANVILQVEGERLTPRVTDFGLARHLEDDGAGLTRTNQGLGTPGYMSPEQIKSARDVDERADIFSLGCILYELVCGREPFPGTDLHGVFDAILGGRFVPPDQVVPGLAPVVASTINRCLAVDRTQRPPDCDALLRLLGGPGLEPAGPPTLAPGSAPRVEAAEGWLSARVRVEADGSLHASLDGGPFARLELNADAVARADREARRLTSGRESVPAELARVGEPLARLLGQGGSARVRLALDGGLGGMPWELALGASLAAGQKPGLHLVRAVASGRPVVPREVSGALRVLVADALGPPDEVDALRRALGPFRRTGEVEWLDPVEGAAVRFGSLVARLREPPRPHVLVLRCALRVGSTGARELKLGPGEADWISADMLALALDRKLCKETRVVVLDAVAEGGASVAVEVAEALSTDGIAAALCWGLPVEPGGRTGVITAYLGALAGPAEGDVVAALGTAREAGGGVGSVGGLAPVLALRGDESRLFRYERRVLHPVASSVDSTIEAADAPSPAQERLRSELQGVLATPGQSTVFVGDAVDPRGDRTGMSALHRQLARRLERGDHEHIASLMQAYELIEDRDELRALVQHTLEEVLDDEDNLRLELVDGVARMAAPGLFITLLWLPLLEASLAHHHPDRRIIVLQPLRPGGLARLKEFRREAGDERWRRGGDDPDIRPDFERDFVVLRLFGGCATPGRGVHGDPVLTENDVLDQLNSLDHLPDAILAYFRRYPVVSVGFSPRSWAHRETLRRLAGGQPLAGGSMAALPADADEADERYWQWDKGPAGGRGGVRIVTYRDLLAATR